MTYTYNGIISIAIADMAIAPASNPAGRSLIADLDNFIMA